MDTVPSPSDTETTITDSLPRRKTKVTIACDRCRSERRGDNDARLFLEDLTYIVRQKDRLRWPQATVLSLPARSE